MSKSSHSAGQPGASRCSDEATGSAAEAAGQAYVPGRTLGRSGYVPCAGDQLATKIGHLDALLCLVTSGDWDASQERDDAPVIEFQSLNNSIQSEVLHLAAALACEVHELHEQVTTERMGRPQALRAVSVGGRSTTSASSSLKTQACALRPGVVAVMSFQGAGDEPVQSLTMAPSEARTLAQELLAASAVADRPAAMPKGGAA